MNIKAKFLDGESFMVTIREEVDQDLYINAFIDMQQAAKLKDDLTVALQEYDAQQVQREMENEEGDYN